MYINVIGRFLCKIRNHKAVSHFVIQNIALKIGRVLLSRKRAMRSPPVDKPIGLGHWCPCPDSEANARFLESNRPNHLASKTVKMLAFSAVWCEAKRDLARRSCQLGWQASLPHFCKHLYAKPYGCLFKEGKILGHGACPLVPLPR